MSYKLLLTLKVTDDNGEVVDTRGLPPSHHKGQGVLISTTVLCESYDVETVHKALNAVHATVKPLHDVLAVYKPKVTGGLVEGRIPPHTVCPYRDQCEIAQAGVCLHRGQEHATAFSCATARGFELVSRR